VIELGVFPEDTLRSSLERSIGFGQEVVQDGASEFLWRDLQSLGLLA